MEKADNVAVVPVEMGWNDVGTWEALHELFPQDERGNVLLGRVLDQESKDCILLRPKSAGGHHRFRPTLSWWTPRTPPWSATGTGPRKSKTWWRNCTGNRWWSRCSHTTVERPWGRYTVMDEGPSFKVKRIVVDPGKKLSLQVHQRRAEHWVVVSGHRPGHHRPGRHPGGQQPERLHPPEDPPPPGKPHGGAPAASSRSRPGITWKKMISSAWRMTTGTRIRSKGQLTRAAAVRAWRRPFSRAPKSRPRPCTVDDTVLRYAYFRQGLRRNPGSGLPQSVPPTPQGRRRFLPGR